jgi:hypothetical protein
MPVVSMSGFGPFNLTGIGIQMRAAQDSNEASLAPTALN